MSFSTFQEITIDLTANEETKRHLVGSFLRVIAAADEFEIGVSGEEWISGFAGLGIASEVDGATGERPTFSELRFKETKGAANTIRVIVGTGQIFDDRVVFGGTSVPVDFDGTQPVGFDGTQPVAVQSLPAVALDGTQPVAVQSLPAVGFDGEQPVVQGTPNGWRTPSPNVFATNPTVSVPASGSVFLIAANAGNVRSVVSNAGTETIWIKNSSALGASGLPVAPGESVEFSSQANVYAANPSSIAVPIDIHSEVWT